MLDFFYSTLTVLNLNLILFLILSSGIFFILFVLNPSFFLNKKILQYSGIQKVHEGNISRFGGYIIYTFSFLYYFINNKLFGDWISIFLFISMPLMVLMFIEDYYQSIDFRIRLIALFVTTFLFLIFCINEFPMISFFGLFEFLLSNKILEILFFAICMVALVNGFNFIDGMNGLLGFYIVGLFLSCFTLSYLVESHELAAQLLVFVIPMIIFLFFNYPFGKIFMGDGGAYFIGFFYGLWTINFFSIYDYLSSWNAILIFFYPIIEVIFSFTRKIFKNNSPFLPDRGHLHLKIFDLLYFASKKNRLSNNLVVIFLGIFWLIPPLIIPIVYTDNIFIFISFFFLLTAYSVLMIFIPEKGKY